MSTFGTCSNTERCSKAIQGERIEIYAGFGEHCPECGRRLVPVATTAAAEPEHARVATVAAQRPPELAPVEIPIDDEPAELATAPTLAATRRHSSPPLSRIGLAAGLLLAAAAGIAAYLLRGAP
jgi:hypothetical protein